MKYQTSIKIGSTSFEIYMEDYQKNPSHKTVSTMLPLPIIE